MYNPLYNPEIIGVCCDGKIRQHACIDLIESRQQNTKSSRFAHPTPPSLSQVVPASEAFRPFMTIHQESNFDLSDFLAETLKNQNLKTQTNLNGNGFAFLMI